MKTELVRIGNSRGVRIPKPFIEQLGLGEKVELRVENDRIVISPDRRPRHGWEEKFRSATPADHDQVLLPEGNDFDSEEWQW